MGLMMMLKRTVVGALIAGALVVLAVGPAQAAAHGTVHVATCHDDFGGPGGGCPNQTGGL
jgi:hypothetical protein